MPTLLRKVNFMKIVHAFCVAALCAAGAAFAEEQRRLSAHEHGHGHLNVAIEAKRVSMELEVPGADILGFEHAPSNAEERAAVDDAKAKLASASSLFKLPPDAGCGLDGARVSAGDHDETASAAEENHSEFRAEYDLECRAVGKLTVVEFAYFSVFPGTEELEVNVISPKGQSTYKVTRDKPILDLAGII